MRVDILRLRLHNTGLSNSPFDSPAEVVAHLGAVQSQDFAAAKWAVGLRMKKATDDVVERAFNEGKFLRTHVMRPTWHFVMPEDIRWMLELTSPRVKKILMPYDRRLGITEELISRSQSVIEDALKGRSLLTRSELAEHLEGNKILARGQKLAHILYYAEMDALICSGPRRGRQFTYGLLEELAPKAKSMKREEALRRLALKYFTSHGPAQIEDFRWWSGLTARDAREALGLAESELITADLDGKTYWFSPRAPEGDSKPALDVTKQAFLLSIYDEYTIAYRDRSALSEKRDIERMISRGNALTAVIVLGGRVAGTWKRILKKDTVEITLSPFRKLDKEENRAVMKATERYAEFLDRSSLVVLGLG